MNDLAGKHIVLGLSGGIACYKSAELCRALIKEGATVQVVMTQAAEQFILTISERGNGKRSSSYEYRITNRGGQGLVAMALWEGKKGAETIKEKIGPLVGSFPVEEAGHLLLVTDRGPRTPAPGHGLRPPGRRRGGPACP